MRAGCVLRGSPEALNARRLPPSQALVLDLGQDNGLATGGALVEQARTGHTPVPKTQAVPVPRQTPDDDDEPESFTFGSSAPSVRGSPDERIGSFALVPEFPPSRPTPPPSPTPTDRPCPRCPGSRSGFRSSLPRCSSSG